MTMPKHPETRTGRQTLRPGGLPNKSGKRASSIACGIGALVFSGVAQALIAPPFSLVWLHLVSWVPALFVISRLRGTRALLAGWLVGASANWAIFYWLTPTIVEFSNLPFAAAVALHVTFGLLFGFYVAVFAAGFNILRAVSGRWWALMAAAWFTACEYLNPQLFPYFQGVAWYKVPAVFLITSLTGIAGATFIIMLANCVALQILEQVRRRGGPLVDGVLIRGTAALGVCTAIAVGWSGFRLVTLEKAEGGAGFVRVAIVQPNRDVSQQSRMIQSDASALADDLVALSKEAQIRNPGIDAYFWPEGALYQSPQSNNNATVLRFAQAAGSEVWTGAACRRRDPEGSWSNYNSVFHVSREGSVDAGYDKCILVPFGEYMPLRSIFPFLHRIQGVGAVRPGKGLQVFRSERGRCAPLICFESIHHRYVRKAVNLGADLLVNLTYDTWFGKTAAPYQHLMLASVQAAQYGVPLIRAATSGISAVVDARGRILESTSLFERGVLVSALVLARVPSPYATIGDWCAWACIVSSLTGLWLAWWKRDGNRRWRLTWVCVAGFVALAPLGWLAEPYVPAADWLVWGYALTVMLFVPLKEKGKRWGERMGTVTNIP